MPLFTEPFPVNDESEKAAVQRILGSLSSFREWEPTLGKYSDTQLNSQLQTDDAAVPNYPVSQFAYAQLVVAFGCLDSLRRMIVEEDDDTVHLSAGPYGPYALVRNAMDSAALALWMLEPVNSKLRVKRRITAQMAEIQNALQFRVEMDLPAKSWAKAYRERMQEVWDQADVGTHDVRKLAMPTTTKLLRNLERLHDKSGISWLGAWQLSSGHAHGKQWATLMSNEMEEMDRTANDLGAEFKITISYANFSLVMTSCEHLMQVACQRYTELARTVA